MHIFLTGLGKPQKIKFFFSGPALELSAHIFFSSSKKRSFFWPGPYITKKIFFMRLPLLSTLRNSVYSDIQTLDFCLYIRNTFNIDEKIKRAKREYIFSRGGVCKVLIIFLFLGVKIWLGTAWVVVVGVGLNRCKVRIVWV